MNDYIGYSHLSLSIGPTSIKAINPSSHITKSKIHNQIHSVIKKINSTHNFFVVMLTLI
jgi:hypothetical protein